MEICNKLSQNDKNGRIRSEPITLNSLSAFHSSSVNFLVRAFCGSSGASEVAS